MYKKPLENQGSIVLGGLREAFKWYRIMPERNASLGKLNSRSLLFFQSVFLLINYRWIFFQYSFCKSIHVIHKIYNIHIYVTHIYFVHKIHTHLYQAYLYHSYHKIYTIHKIHTYHTFRKIIHITVFIRHCVGYNLNLQ